MDDAVREATKDRSPVRREEREAARNAADKIRARLTEFRNREQDTVLVYSLHDPWQRTMFVALCRRYGLRPYREPRQRRTTVYVSAPRSFQERTLWPECEALSRELATHLRAVTERVIHEAIHADATDAEEAADPKQLPRGDVLRRNLLGHTGSYLRRVRLGQQGVQVLLTGGNLRECLTQIAPWIEAVLPARRDDRQRVGGAARTVVVAAEEPGRF